MIYQTIDILPDYDKLEWNHTDYQPKLITYILENSPEIDSNRKRPAVIVCPGDGYAMTSDREAEAVAIRMNAYGFQAFVLRYSVAPARFPTALTELAYAVSLVRSQAEAWHIDPHKIIVMGFSAGGHLACSLGCFWNQKFLSDLLQTENHLFRPNGMILSYPVISSGKFAHRGSFEHLLGIIDPENSHSEEWERVSLEKQVSADTPPAFLWHTYEDPSVPVENSLLFALAMKQHDIPLELHIYPHGGHGLSLANEESMDKNGFGVQPECQNWIQMAATWIQNL